jgi:integrase
LFALRWNDIRANRLRIDESVSRFEESGVKAPKTADSEAFVTLPGALAQELEGWRKSCHAVRPADFVFPSATGTAVSEHNYERDVLVPVESEAGIMPPRVQGQAYRRDKAAAVNFQSLRRTFATWMQKTGATVKDVQTAMRHSTPDHSIRTYVKEIPESVRMAVQNLDAMLTLTTQGRVQ